jgi:hypothetical protein
VVGCWFKRKRHFELSALFDRSAAELGNRYPTHALDHQGRDQKAKSFIVVTESLINMNGLKVHC